MQSVTASTTTTPQGSDLAALGIKTNTLNAPFEDTKSEVEYIQGTISACLNARAQERAALKFVVLQRGKPTATAKQLQRVLDFPNPVQSRVDFLESLSQFHDATGNGMIYFVLGDASLPAEMWILPTYYVVALFNEANDPVPTAYRLADGRVIASIENLCFIRQNSVKTAPYTGRGLLGDMINSAVLYDLVNRSQVNWFQMGGAPNIALVQPQGSILTEDQIAAIQKTWNDKYNTANGTSNIAVLPDGVKPENFGPQEMGFTKSKEEIRDAIREYLQTPKIILGDTDNVNLNNGQTALAIFDRTIVLRWGEKCASAFEHFFNREYGSGFTVTLDQGVAGSFAQIQLAAPAAPDTPAEEVLPGKELAQA